MTDQTSPATSTAPRWPLAVVVVVLLPLAVVGSAVLSGAGTLALFANAGFPEQVQPFGLGMVEVLSLAGTLLRVFAVGEKLRRDALVAVLGSTAVSMVGGFALAGWVGLLAGIALVGLVHLAAESWLELRARSTAPAAVVDQASTAVAPTVVSEKEETEEVVEKPADERPDELDERTEEQAGPVYGCQTLAEAVRELDARPGDRPSERAAAGELGVSRHAIRTARVAASGLLAVTA